MGLGWVGPRLPWRAAAPHVPASAAGVPGGHSRVQAPLCPGSLRLLLLKQAFKMRVIKVLEDNSLDQARAQSSS